jgi:hypothetical protein
MAFEKDPDELGALWLKSGAKGDYMTGEINGVKVVCFPVTKGGDKSPTWRVLKSKPREEPIPNDQRTSVGKVVTSQDVPF